MKTFEQDTIVSFDYRIREMDGSPIKPIGFLLSKPKNMFYKKHIHESKKSYNDHEYQSIGTTVVKRVSNSFEECTVKYYHNKFQNLIQLPFVHPVIGNW